MISLDQEFRLDEPRNCKSLLKKPKTVISKHKKDTRNCTLARANKHRERNGTHYLQNDIIFFGILKIIVAFKNYATRVDIPRWFLLKVLSSRIWLNNESKPRSIGDSKVQIDERTRARNGDNMK